MIVKVELLLDFPIHKTDPSLETGFASLKLEDAAA